MIAYEGGRVRPGVFGAFGLRYGRQPRVPGEPPEVAGRAVAGAGVDLRYYVVPRYFVEADARIEYGGEAVVGAGGVGFGVHVGR